MQDIVIVGASGFGRELIQYFLDEHQHSTDFRIKGLLDDDPLKLGTCDVHSGVSVIGNTNHYAIEPNDRFLVSVGDPKIRRLLSERLANRGARFFTLRHPTAYVAPSARIGAGCILGPFSSVGAYAVLHDHVLLNLYAAVGHDATVWHHSVFSPYAVANGGAVIGNEVFLGSHAVVTPQINVGEGSKIAAAAVAYRDVPAFSMVSGNPAKAVPLRIPSQQSILN